MRICSVCGEHNEDWMDICQRCGNSIVNADVDNSYEAQNNFNNYEKTGENNNTDVINNNNIEIETKTKEKKKIENIDLKIVLVILLIILACLIIYNFFM